MTITIQLAPALAESVRRGGGLAQPLLDLLRQKHARFTAIEEDPSAESPLRDFFLIEIENPETGAMVLSLLQRTTGVEAAYVKPAEETP